MGVELWPHQQAAIAFALARPASLLHMGMATGKTRVACEVMAQTGGRCLILCPKSVIPTWVEEAKKWYGIDVLVPTRSWSAARKGAAIASASHTRVAAINYDAAIYCPDQLASVAWSCVVLDESQRIKGHDSRSARTCWTLRAARRLCLSGTPMPHSPLDAWAQFRFLDRTVLGESFVVFKKRYAILGVKLPIGLPPAAVAALLALSDMQRAHCVRLLETKVFRSSFRQSLRQQLDRWLTRPLGSPFTPRQWAAMGRIEPQHLLQVVGFRDLDQIKARMAPLTFTARTEDVLKLTGAEHVVRHVELEPEALAIYRDMERDLVAEVRGGVVTAANAMVKVGKLMQVTGGTLRGVEDPDAPPVETSRRRWPIGWRTCRQTSRSSCSRCSAGIWTRSMRPVENGAHHQFARRQEERSADREAVLRKANGSRKMGKRSAMWLVGRTTRLGVVVAWNSRVAPTTWPSGKPRPAARCWPCRCAAGAWEST